MGHFRGDPTLIQQTKTTSQHRTIQTTLKPSKLL